MPNLSKKINNFVLEANKLSKVSTANHCPGHVIEEVKDNSTDSHRAFSNAHPEINFFWS
jgi:hypothetical protein